MKKNLLKTFFAVLVAFSALAANAKSMGPQIPFNDILNTASTNKYTVMGYVHHNGSGPAAHVGVELWEYCTPCTLL